MKSTSAVTALTPIVAKLIYSIKEEAPEGCLCEMEVAAESAKGGGFWGTDGAVRFDGDEMLKYPVGEGFEGVVGLT